MFFRMLPSPLQSVRFAVMSVGQFSGRGDPCRISDQPEEIIRKQQGESVSAGFAFSCHFLS